MTQQDFEAIAKAMSYIPDTPSKLVALRLMTDHFENRNATFKKAWFLAAAKATVVLS